MPSAELNVRDGEATLMKKLYESPLLEAVVEDAAKRELVPNSLGMDRVTKDEPWVSTDTSTVVAPVLYLRGPVRGNFLIVKRPGDENYGLYAYRWTM